VPEWEPPAPPSSLGDVLSESPVAAGDLLPPFVVLVADAEVRVRVFVCVRACACVCAHARACACACMCVRACVRVRAGTCVGAFASA
jgi:hypothetical protein